MKILMIGPDITRIGGTTVSFRYLKDDLEKNYDLSIVFISSSDIRGAGYYAINKYIRMMVRIVRSVQDCDVITFHAMPTALPYIGWFLPTIKKYYNKPLLYRAFGGMYYDELSWVGRTIARYFIQKSDLVLLQTHELINKAKKEKNVKVDYFPTARPMCHVIVNEVKKCKKFVYIGHLKVAKGLGYLAKAAEKIPNDAVIDVYGPWYDLPKETFDACNKIQYKGVINSDDVLDTLRKYDALVFPTFMKEEGYSGIIFEAYSVGIPVIVSNWRALPEIVEDGKTGILVEPRNDEAILRAINKLYQDSEYYMKLRRGVLEERKKYSQEKQTKKFINFCESLIITSKKYTEKNICSKTKPFS